jgi:hypothetical protein
MNKLLILCVLAAIAAFPQAQTPLTITQSAGSATGEIRMQERRTNGTDYVGLKAPQSISSNTVWTLPNADGTSGQCLSTDGAGVLSFAACAGYWTLSGSDIYRSTGVVTIGHTSPTVRLGQNLNTNYAGNFGGIAMNVFSATGGHGAVLDFNKSASGTLGSHGAVASGDTLGFFVFRGSDGAAFQRGAEVLGEVDGSVSSGIVPGRLRFRTANTSGTMTERWRIDSAGALTAGTHNSWDIGTSTSAGSARSIFAGTSVVTPVVGRNTFAALGIMTDSTTRWNFSAAGMLLPATTDTYDIGDLTTPSRVRGVYSKYVDTALSGGTGDYIQTRKLQLFSNDGATTGAGFWALNAVMSGVGAGQNSYFYLTDNAGVNVFRTDRIASGSAVDTTKWYTDLVPDTNLGQNIGSTSLKWNGVWANQLGDSLNLVTVYGANSEFSGLTINTGSAVAGYVWTASSTGGAGDWAPPALDEFDVRSYGAVCDGTTDDTVAIQAAIDAATGIEGIVLLPRGACKVTTIEMTSSFRGVRGQGINVSQLYSNSNAPIIHIDTGTMSGVDFYAMEFSNFTLLGNGSSSGQYGFEVEGIGSINNSDFHHLWFEDLQIGFYLHTDGSTGSGHNKFHENWFSLSNTNAIGIYRKAPEGSGWMISGNDFGGAAGSIGDTSGPRAIVMRDFIGDLMINDNHMEGGWVAVDLSCDDGLLPKAITAGTNANPVSLTATGHGRTGSITVSLNGFTGAWAVLNGEWTATVTGSNTFTIPVNTTSLGAMTGTNAELTSSGACLYGNNIVATGNKIDGYALDGRMYNVQNSSFTGNRGRGILREQIRGSKNALAYDVMGYTDTGSAINRTGYEMTTATGGTSINGYDEGRLRLGDTTQNISNARNGISILDVGASSAIGLGQSATRNMGMLWTYNATAAAAYGLVYTYSYANPMFYGASKHTFLGAAGPGLGTGLNESPVWIYGTSGFIGYGMVRSDDSNGGWLIGTSAVSAGDFAIYQNQGAGTPAKRFLIDTSGTVDIPGNLSVSVMNATGSPAYRVSGTTVIDASRHATFVNLTSSGTITLSGTVASDILFGSSNTYIVGNSTNYLNAIHANNVVAYASFLPASGVSTVDVGSATRRVRKTYTGDIDITGTVTPPSGTAFSGTKTVRDSAGTGTCTLTFSSGIMTGGTC